MTPSTAAPATTASLAAVATTSCTAARATTKSSAAPGPTRSCNSASGGLLSGAPAREQGPPDEQQREREADQREGGVEAEARLNAVDEGRYRGREDGRGQAQPDRATGDLEHVDDAAGEAGLRVVDGGDPGGRGGRVEAADPEPEHDHPRDQRAVAGATVDLGEEERGDGDAGGAEHRQRLGPAAGVEGGGGEGGGGGGAGGREGSRRRLPGASSRTASP